jgi:hypothetical protein
LPFPLLAHQAPVLPLKAWRPDWFSGTALVVGSIAPDLEYLASPKRGITGFGHSLEGQFLFCVPITLAVVLYMGRLRIGETLASRLGWPLLAKAAIDTSGVEGVLKVVLSALTGSFSHIALDVMTHRLAPRWFHFIGVFRWHGQLLNATSIAQLGLSFVFGLVSLLLLRRMVKNAEPAPAPRSDGRALLMVAAIVGAMVGGWRARPAFKDPELYFYAAHVYVWGHAVFHVACGIAVAWLIVGGYLSWRDARQTAARAA